MIRHVTCEIMYYVHRDCDKYPKFLMTVLCIRQTGPRMNAGFVEYTQLSCRSSAASSFERSSQPLERGFRVGLRFGETFQTLGASRL